MSPRKAKSFRQICSLREDNNEKTGWWWMVDGNDFAICKQQSGESPEIGPIHIPRRVFNAMVDWYGRDQHPERPQQ